MDKHIKNLYKEMIQTNENCADLAKITCRSLMRIGRCIVIGFAAGIFHATYTERCRIAMQKEIDDLKSTVKELSKTKEE